MEKRRFGRTGHMSTLGILGGFSLGYGDQAEADSVVEMSIAAGVNHIDIAPSYGEAEAHLGPWLRRERERFFLGCKTMERTKEGAAAEMRGSLQRLQTERFDLYQIHAITTRDELDEATRRGGALEAIVEAREAGLTRYIGITGHGMQAPALFLEALRRFDFDTVLFPVNFVLYADPVYRQASATLLEECTRRDVGVMAIKAIARGLWGTDEKAYATWYRPFDDEEHIRQGIDFSLSQEGVTCLCSTGEPSVVGKFFAACERYQPMARRSQDALIATAGQYEQLWA